MAGNFGRSTKCAGLINIVRGAKSLSGNSTFARADTRAKNLSWEGASGLTRGILNHFVLVAQRLEHVEQVAEAAHRDDDRDVGERGAGDEQATGQEPDPGLHRRASPPAGLNLPASLSAEGRVNNEPAISPVAASPKATKPVTFSDQGKKKKGTMAPMAPINMAR